MKKLNPNGDVKGWSCLYFFINLGGGGAKIGSCCNSPIKHILRVPWPADLWFSFFFFTALRSHHYLWKEGGLKLLSPKSHADCIRKPSRLFLNSLTSVRVFTRMVSDNPWCSLWVPSSQSWTSKITMIFSCLHIHEWTSLTKTDFQQKQIEI